MKTMDMNPEELLPLTPAVFHILLALTDGERHGYAIMREVAESTNRQINMGPGTLYGTIKRMLEAGLIEESDRRPDAKEDDERRRYYCLTGLGRRVAEAEASRYNELAKLVRRKRLLAKPGKTVPAGGI
jgi:DNA-binding PadR family transcriptional regulator